MLRLKVRDLGLAQLRLARPFDGLADGYRTTLAAFLAQPADETGGGKSPRAPRSAVSARETIKKLDALDVARRNAETRLDATRPPGTVSP